MMKKSSWLRVVLENRRTILRLIKDGVFRWVLPQKAVAKKAFDVVTPDISGEANA
jgi:hypothetical protein